LEAVAKEEELLKEALRISKLEHMEAKKKKKAEKGTKTSWTEKSDPGKSPRGARPIRSLTSQTPRRSAAPQRARHPATAQAGVGMQVPSCLSKDEISVLNALDGTSRRI
jgi:hypothetical protein